MFDWANYRPIMVTDILYRLFMRVLNARLSQWCEDNHILPDEQFGFRPGRGTVEAAFVLQHAADKAKSGRLGRPSRMFAAFLDLDKAYDRVDRQALWAALRNLSIPDAFINTLVSVYTSTTVSLKLHGRVSHDVLAVSRGVRQGCPLSPLLFNLCLAGLPAYIKATVPGAGVNLAQSGSPPASTHSPLTILLAILLYADDIVLVASSADVLQRQLDATVDYCARFGLCLSPTKSCVTVFRPPRARCSPSSQWHVGPAQTPIPVVDRAVYLGVAFHCTMRHAFALKQRALLAMRAISKVHAVLHSLRLGKPIHTSLHLLAAIIRPALSYGAALTGLSCIKPATVHRSISYAESVYLKQLSWALSLGRGTPRYVLYRESGQFPLPADWLADACRLRNRMLNASSPLMQCTMRDELLRPAPHSWGSEFLAALQACGIPCPHISSPLDPSYALSQYALRHYLAWHALASDPASPDCQHRKLSTYISHFDSHTYTPTLPWYIAHIHSAHKQTMLAQLRCSCSPLIPVDAGRIAHTPFTHRTCPACHSAVADITHICFHCPHPALAQVRAHYPHLPKSMAALHAPTFHPHLAVTYILECIHAWCSISQNNGLRGRLM
jgi:hypothetical protein